MIIVSLTTIPERLKKRLPEICIESILKQTINPDYVIVNIPAISNKGEPYSKDLANKLASLSPLIKVQFGVSDLGPITKIIPTLNFIESCNLEHVQIILVDDDCVYETTMIETLMNIKKIKPNELVIGTAGRIKQRNKLEYTGITNYDHGNIANDYIYVDIIETFAGVMYDYSLFKGFNIVKWISTFPDFVMLADDIILSTFAKKQGAKLYKIISDKSGLVRHDPMKTVELNTINDCEGNNDKVYNFFEDYLENERIFDLINRSKNNTFETFAKNFLPS